MIAVVVGLGSAGARHFNHLVHLGVSQIGIYRVRKLPPPVELLQKPNPVFESLDEVWEACPDFMVIANPSALHFAIAQEALRRGIALYLEKPAATDLKQARELVRLAREKNIVVQVGSQLRFHPQLQQVKKWIDDGRLGKLHSVAADMGEWLPGWHPWEDYRDSYAARAELGGGVLLTQIHDIDYLHWLFGPVERVFALGGKCTSLNIDVEDTVLLSLSFKSGLPAQLRMDYWRKPARRCLHIVGELGEIYWDYYNQECQLRDREGQIIAEKRNPATWTRNDLFLMAMENFLAALGAKASLLSDLESATHSLEIALAAQQALRQKRVIDI